MQITSLDKLISYLESKDFFKKFLLINSGDMLLDFMEHDESIKKLKEELLINKHNIDIFEGRIKKLWGSKRKRGYLHPYDHSIAVYLYAIFKTHVEKIEPILSYIYKNKRKNIWFSYLMYNYIVKNLPEDTFFFRMRKISKIPESTIKSLTKNISTNTSSSDTEIH